MRNLSESIVANLLQKSMLERKDFLTDIFECNKKFFKTEAPSIFQLLNSHNLVNYDIQITEKFLNIVERNSQKFFHGPNNLEKESTDLQFLIQHKCFDFINQRSQVLDDKSSLTYQTFMPYEKKINETYDLKEFGLKPLEKENGYYAPVGIFLGVSPGLLMLEYLSQIRHSHIFIYEPDPELFVVSCYFIDYGMIKKSCKRYFLSIGSSSVNNALHGLFDNSHFSPTCWSRVVLLRELPEASAIIETVKLLVNKINDGYQSFELFMKSNKVLSKILKSNVPILSNHIKLDKKSNIAIIGSGPSLNEELDWLYENQNKTVIFGMISSLGLLNDRNIVPDFIFTLDTVITPKNLSYLLTYGKEIPLVCSHITANEYLDNFKELYVCSTSISGGLVRFSQAIDVMGSSSLCFALSFALYSNPKNIFLLGCDLSFSNDNNYHALGTLHEQHEDDYSLKGTGIKVLKNIDRSQTVSTDARLLGYLRDVEVMLKSGNKHSKVYNFSQIGAFIQGAIPVKSNEIKLSKLMQKKYEVNKIKLGFKKSKEAKNWFKFKGSGESVLNQYKADLIKVLKQNANDWQSMFECLDSAAHDCFVKFKQHPKDGRLDFYLYFTKSFLRFVYIHMLNAKSYSEALSLYRFSIEYLEGKMENLIWPSELSDY